MAQIEVNYQVLRSYASLIDEHCELQKREMKAADAAVRSVLGTDWSGLDTVDFGQKWDQVDAGDSTSVQLQKTLENFAKALKASASAYEKAQVDIYNRSALLPR